MIVKVVAYFIEGNHSYFPGETHHAEGLLAERGMAMERVAYWRMRGNLEQTADADTAVQAIDPEHVQEAMAAQAATAPIEEMPLAEGGTVAPMTKQRRA